MKRKDRGISYQDKSVVASQIVTNNDLRWQCNPSVIGKASTVGITLVALVVTIVVLLILAGITLVYVFGDNGVFGQVSKAKIETELGKIEEQAGTIYHDKFIANQGTNNMITAQDIVEELQRRGNPIETRSTGGSITEISLDPTIVYMDQKQTAPVKVELEVSENGKLYYAVIDGKYYKMNFSNGQLTIEREATNPEENKEESANIEVETEYDHTIVTNAQINQTEKTIAITSGTKYGNTELTVKYGSKTEKCKVVVEDEMEKLWGEIAEMAKAIASDSSITNNSTQATVTLNGASKTIKVGEIYNVKYDGVIRRVRVLGFKHDDLVNTGTYGGNHTKASISFEFYDFMPVVNNSMNSSEDNTGGWGATQMRKNLNGYITSEDSQSGSIGGWGAKLSNKSYIKQVKKQYIKTYNDASSNRNFSQDYLWLLACSEVVNAGYQENAYGHAITNEGRQYRYYQGITDEWNSSSSDRIKKTQGYGTQSHWWLRSPYCYRPREFCVVYSNGSVANYLLADARMGVAPGFCI